MDFAGLPAGVEGMERERAEYVHEGGEREDVNEAAQSIKRHSKIRKRSKRFDRIFLLHSPSYHTVQYNSSQYRSSMRSSDKL